MVPIIFGTVGRNLNVFLSVTVRKYGNANVRGKMPIAGTNVQIFGNESSQSPFRSSNSILRLISV